MNSSLCLWNKADIRARAMALGAVAVGFAEAAPVDDADASRLRRWLADGCHGTMDYMARHLDIRLDPRLLLPGAKTVISMAFAYRPPGGYHHPCIADYALGRDYHTVLHGRLAQLSAYIFEHYGALCRPCVDSAPILERYWAQRSGVGFVGRNRQLIVPGIGSDVFLAEVVTTLELAPDSPLHADCGDCGACEAACPGGALCGGSFDARRCLSYLTIEHRGPWPEGAPAPAGHLVGCDDCRRSCPHNAAEGPEPLEDFLPDQRLLKLDAEAVARLTPADWRRLTRNSPLRRVKLAKLKETLGQKCRKD